MTEYQIDALVAFVRREADFAVHLAKDGSFPLPANEQADSEREFREAMRDTDPR